MILRSSDAADPYPVMALRCEGWDSVARSLVGPLDANEVARRDAAGEQYSVGFVSEGLVRVVANISWQWFHCGVWMMDPVGRVTHTFDFRVNGTDEMFLVNLRIWRYSDEQATQGRWNWDEDITATPDDRARRLQRLAGSTRSTSGPIDPHVHRRRAVTGADLQPVLDLAMDFGLIATGGSVDYVTDDEVMSRIPSGSPGRRVWRPPVPTQPTHADLMFTPGMLTTGDGTAVIMRQEPAAALRLTSGRLVAAEPWEAWADDEFVPFQETLPPGTYPVTLAVARFDHPKPLDRVAGVRVEITQAPVHTWEPALRPGQDPRLLLDGHHYGFPVDGGIGSLFDIDATQLAVAEGVGYDLVQDDELLYSELTDPDNRANVIVFAMALGDGAYPTWIGRSADGRIACFVVDALLFNPPDD